MNASAPGMFWCPLCEADFPDSITETHRQRHAAVRSGQDKIFTTDHAIFWALCIAIGIIVALLIAA